MSRTAGVAQGHKSRVVEEEKADEAVAHVPPGEGARSLWGLGELLIYKFPSQQTGGAYSFFEAATDPGAGPPPHLHHREDEATTCSKGSISSW